MSGRMFLMGALAGAGALLLLPGVAAAVAKAARPVARRAGAAGARAYDGARRAGAEAYEHVEDLAAEVRADIAAGRDAVEEPAEPDAPEEQHAGNGADGQRNGIAKD